MARTKAILSAAAASILLLAGCGSSAVYLQLNPLPTGETLQSDLGAKTFNAVRFVTVGPSTSQNIGYFLHDDDVEVTLMPGAPLERMDRKMSLREAVDDYFALSQKLGNKRISPPIIREARRDGKGVGYSVADMNMGADVWDRTGSSGASKTMLELMFEPAESAKKSRSVFAPCR
jgi:hypothetical protein